MSLTLFSLSSFTKRWSFQTCIFGIKCEQICLKIGIGIAKDVSEGRVSHFSNFDFDKRSWKLKVENTFFSDTISTKCWKKWLWNMNSENCKNIFSSFSIDPSICETWRSMVHNCGRGRSSVWKHYCCEGNCVMFDVFPIRRSFKQCTCILCVC